MHERSVKPRGGDAMNDLEIDRILSKQDEILPSSGFVASVMEAVHREAAAPPPIPFPWKRALPCLALAILALVVVLGAAIAALTQIGRGSSTLQIPASLPSPSMLTPVVQGNLASAAGWTCLALLLAFVSVKISMRLAAGRT
jgi:hypothetical protein